MSAKNTAMLALALASCAVSPVLAGADFEFEVAKSSGGQVTGYSVDYGRERLVWARGKGRAKLFDKHDDPKLTKDLASAKPQEAAFLMRALVSHLLGQQAPMPKAGAGAAALPPDAAEALRRMGYLSK